MAYAVLKCTKARLLCSVAILNHVKSRFLGIALLLSGLVFGIHGFQKGRKEQPFRLMFYNVENLYDVKDDPQVDDADFLPSGEMQWTQDRLDTKLEHIAQVIRTVGGKNLPDVVGFAEIENRDVLDMLVLNTGLKKSGYMVIHYNSPDKRGIDVGLIYRRDRFTPLKKASYPVVIPGSDKPTRDILYVQGQLPNKAKLNILVNHWPSRSGGQAETEPKRMLAAKAARRVVDSLLLADKEPNVVLVGDFNDYPSDKSIREVLQAEADTSIPSGELFNLVAWQQTKEWGSHQYKGEWGFLDQVIVSEALLKGRSMLKTGYTKAKVYRPDFLVEKNEKFNNWQPKRTYGGKNYLGGYSDHLPVYVDIEMMKP